MFGVRSALTCSILYVVISGCSLARPQTPPQNATIPPPPVIYERTPHGLVPVERAMTDQRDEEAYDGSLNSQADVYDLRDPRWRSGEGLPDALRLRYSRPIGKGPPPIDATTAEPIYPQTYYVRPEHTSTGYIEGRYGRIDNFTPGEHTSTEYVPGNYRGDGTYTRPDHTPKGYVPGHYRAVPQPGNPASQIGVQRSTSGSSRSSNR